MENTRPAWAAKGWIRSTLWSSHGNKYDVCGNNRSKINFIWLVKLETNKKYQRTWIAIFKIKFTGASYPDPHKMSILESDPKSRKGKIGKYFNRGIFYKFFCVQYFIQQCFICSPSDSTVMLGSITGQLRLWHWNLAVGRSNHSARSHPHLARSSNINFFTMILNPTFQTTF
jgi:hypothetical protein